MWPAAVATPAGARRCSARADELRGRLDEDVRDPGVDAGPEPARDRGATASTSAPLEITTCLRRGAELEIDVRYRAEDAEELREALFDGPARAPRRLHLHRDGRDDRRASSPGCSRAARSALGGVLHRRAAGRAAHRPAGLLGLLRRRRRRLLERGQDGAARRPAELIEAHGAVSPEVAEAMADGAIERFDADVGVGDHRRRRARRRHRGKAGRLRLHLRQARRRRGCWPASRCCPAAARTSATARRASRCT